MEKIIEHLSEDGFETKNGKLASKIEEVLMGLAEPDEARNMVSQTEFNLNPDGLRVRAIRAMNRELKEGNK